MDVDIFLCKCKKIETGEQRLLQSGLNMMRVGRIPEQRQWIILISARCFEFLMATTYSMRSIILLQINVKYLVHNDVFIRTTEL